MKTIVFIICLIPCIVQADNILDILKDRDNSFALQRELKNDIGSLFIPSNRPDDFINAFENQRFDRALHLWIRTIQGNSFSRSSTGSALYSYLLFKNGFEFLSLKNLFEKSKPEEVNSIVKKLWKISINKKRPLWNYFFFPVSRKWLELFDEEMIFRLGSKTPLQLKSKEDQEYIKFLLELPLNDNIDVFSLEWFLVLSLIRKNDMRAATKILAWLISKTKDQNKKDMIHLTIGRLLADIGEWEASLNYYAQIEKPSYFWLFAQEEKAWIFFNTENYGKAYSTVSAFLYPGFKKKMNSYMFFILALAQLKNCDYKGLARSLSDFESFFSIRKMAIEKNLKSNSYNNLIKELLAFYHSENSYYKLRKSNLFYQLRKDDFLKNHLLLYNHIKNRKTQEKMKFKSLIEIEFEMINQLEEKIKKRFQTLLRKEMKKIDFVLKNFQIIGTEALYRIHGFHALFPVSLLSFDDSVLPAFNPVQSGSVLFFPFDLNEIWLDELSTYQSKNLKNCPRGHYVL